MKTHFWKKAAALALVLSLFVSLLSVAAMAAESDPEDPVTEITQPQENDLENPVITQKEDSEEAPDETQDSDTEEGPVPDVSLLSDDAAAEEVDTNDAEQPPEGSQPELQSEPSGCTNGGAHTPDLTQELPLSAYTSCGGGYKEPGYPCTVCGATVTKDGANASWEEGTGVHTPGTEKYPANYTSCGGGIKTEWYQCTVCNYAVNADGSEVTSEQGTGEHTPGEKHAPDYVSCDGGFQTEYYICTACRLYVDADGNPISPVRGTGVHIPGAEKHAESYVPCRGGWTTEWYECTECGYPVKADGSRAEWADGTGQHTPGDKFTADYTECGGGYATDGYICTVCGNIVNADGSEVEYIEGTGRHTPGDELIPAASTPCYGGYTTDHYWCTTCSRAVNADGSVVDWIEGNGEHQTVYVPAAAPTYEEWGHQAYWECSVCNLPFADSAGKRMIYENIWIPSLTRDTEVKTESLTAVPETIAEEYPTVEAVQTALLNSAKSVGFQPDAAGAGGVLLDVTLQIRNADGTLTPVKPDEFPAEGVTVVIPYPAGTDKNYTFFLTHMITHGPRAGQTEVLTSVNGEDGIYVYFTSMSPVYISYMLEAGAPAPATPAPAPTAPVVSSTVPKTSDPSHGAPWGMLALLSIGGLGALSIAGKKLRSF